MKNPYSIIKERYITEKSTVIENLKSFDSNKSLRACKKPKYAFLVDNRATKIQIAQAVEEIYRARKIKVKKVNTINAKSKPKKMRGVLGRKPGFKKAIVTLDVGQSIEEV